MILIDEKWELKVDLHPQLIFRFYSLRISKYFHPKPPHPYLYYP